MPGETVIGLSTARKAFVAILVCSILISYVTYEFYFTAKDKSKYLRQDDDTRKGYSNYSALQQKETNNQANNTKHTEKMEQFKSKYAVSDNIENGDRSENLVAGKEENVGNTIKNKTDTHNYSTVATSKIDIEAESHDIEVYGTVEAGKKYAAFGCHTPVGNDYNFPFYLPLSIQAWQRINFSTIVTIIGRREQWLQSKVLRVVLNQLETLGGVVIFIHSHPNQVTMWSQVLRLFIPLLVPWTPGEHEPYLVTADADIWPLSTTLYDLTPGTKMVTSNSECCGNFIHRGQKFKMVPMCYVGMYLSTWCDVMQYPPGKSIKGLKFIIDYLTAEFGKIVSRRVKKGNNKGWYLDQRLISIRIHQWESKHSSKAVRYIPRNTRADRIDRKWWHPHSLEGKNDAHMPKSGYQPKNWKKSLPLMQLMFNQTILIAAEKYHEHFLHMLSEIKSSD